MFVLLCILLSLLSLSLRICASSIDLGNRLYDRVNKSDKSDTLIIAKNFSVKVTVRLLRMLARIISIVKNLILMIGSLSLLIGLIILVIVVISSYSVVQFL